MNKINLQAFKARLLSTLDEAVDGNVYFACGDNGYYLQCQECPFYDTNLCYKTYSAAEWVYISMALLEEDFQKMFGI